MQSKIEAILAYQEAKNQLVLEATSVELIPNYLKLTKEDLTEDVIELIKANFSPTSVLVSDNCLHCAIHFTSCNNCPYNLKGEECIKEDSLYALAYETQHIINGLYEIGQKFREKLDKEH